MSLRHVLRKFPGSRRGRLGMLVGSLTVIGVAILARYHWAPSPATAQRTRVRPASAQTSPAKEDHRRVVARVNGEEIRHDQLAHQCLNHYGERVLESYVNKHLIATELKKRGLTVLQADVNQEIQKMAKKVNLPTEQLLRLLEEERGISRERYAKDIIWPMLALRKLAANRLEVTREDLQTAWDSRFGPRVRAQLIQLHDEKTAQAVLAKARAHPDAESFGRLAAKFSDDKNSASVKGWVQPIRRNVGEPKIEHVAFSLKTGDISPVIRVREGLLVIIRSQGVTQPAHAPPLKEVADKLTDEVRQSKLRVAAHDVFRTLQKDVKIQNVFNDSALRAKHPGVAALVNGRPISTADLAEECVERHGKDVLEGELNRKILEQALKLKRMTVTHDDLNAEISQASKRMGFPNREEWIEYVTARQNVNFDIYVADAVWPSVALKKLVVDRIKVSDEDLQKAFISSYGPRVRCQVIVLDSFRRAKEVWGKARQNPTAEFFGKLAQQYSVEASTRVNNGEAPPIKKFGGRPLLEKEAFALQPGQLSSIIELDGRFIILRCRGRTKTQDIKLEDVADDLRADLYDVELRQQMAKEFERLRKAAQIDNYLAGTSQDGKTASRAGAARNGSRK